MAKVTATALKRGAAYAVASQLWRLGSRFILTPIIIGKVGLDGYGTWTLLFSIVAYVSMFNTSAGLAYTNFTAQYDQRGDYQTLSEIISAGIVIMGGLSFVVLAGIWFARTPLLRLVNVPEEMLPDAKAALLVVEIAVFLQMTFGSVFQVVSGLQRVDLRHKLMILSSALSFCITIPLLVGGYGLLGLAIGYLSGWMIAAGTGWALVRLRICPELRISLFSIPNSAFREMGSLTGRFQVLSLLSTMYSSGLYVIISSLGGTSSVAVFDLAKKLLDLARTFSAAVIAPLMPAFASLHSAQDISKRRRLYALSAKVVASTAVVCFSVLVIFADRALVVWTADEYPLAAWSIRALVGVYFMVTMTAVTTADLRGRATVRLEMSYSIVQMVITLALLYPAFTWWGYEGMVLSVLVGGVAGAFWFQYFFAREEGSNLGGYVREILMKPFLIGAVAVGMGLLLRPVVDNLVPAWPPRWSAFFEMATWGVCFALFTGLALWYALFSREDRQFLIQRIRRTQPRVSQSL